MALGHSFLLLNLKNSKSPTTQRKAASRLHSGRASIPERPGKHWLRPSGWMVFGITQWCPLEQCSNLASIAVCHHCGPAVTLRTILLGFGGCLKFPPPLIPLPSLSGSNPHVFLKHFVNTRWKICEWSIIMIKKGRKSVKKKADVQSVQPTTRVFVHFKNFSTKMLKLSVISLLILSTCGLVCSRIPQLTKSSSGRRDEEEGGTVTFL